MAKKTIITAAVTGAWPKKENNPNVPLTPAEISEDVYACWCSGAAVAHLHMRDDQGNGTMDKNKFAETLRLLKENHPDCDIVLNLTTSGDLEDIGVWGTWEPCHKEMLGHGIVGVENLGGDLDKIPAGVWFRFNCFPLRWYMGDGSMARCVAEIDEDLIDKTVPDRTYAYGGTGYGFPEGNGDSGLEYMQRLFNRNKKKK